MTGSSTECGNLLLAGLSSFFFTGHVAGMRGADAVHVLVSIVFFF